MKFSSRFLILSLIFLGYIVILAAVASISSIASNNIQKLRLITQDLYEHPFAVSNASIDLKSSLFQVRNYVLQVAVIRKDIEYAKVTKPKVEALYKTIKADLAVIKGNFLGDMNRVIELETKLDQWTEIHKKIFAAAQQGDFKSAEILVISEGSPKFSEIEDLINYVVTFAQNKGRSFVVMADEDSNLIVFQTNALLIFLVIVVIVTAVIVIWRVIFLQNQLTRLATTDYLTGIPNRRHFIELAERELKRSLRYGNHFVLAVVDLDLFKRINDTYGHHAGDVVLKEFGVICRMDLRDTDILGRIGGEEFAIMLPNISLSEAKDVIERIREDVENANVQISKNSAIRFTASFGLSESNANTLDLDTIIKFADEALYQAKQTGRNKVSIHEDFAAIENH